MRQYLTASVSIVSAIAAVAAACAATWQALEARSASKEAYKFALASERLESCILMNNLETMASMTASYVGIIDKPYRDNPEFIRLTMIMHNFGDETIKFREMTPGEASNTLSDLVWQLRITLKDMVADGGDYLKHEDIREKISGISSARRDICTRMLGPSGGF